AQHRPEFANARKAALHRPLVAIVAQEIDAIRSGEVIGPIAVKVGDRHAFTRLYEGSDLQMSADKAPVLERHPIGLRELKVGDCVDDLRGSPVGFSKARLIK